MHPINQNKEKLKGKIRHLTNFDDKMPYVLNKLRPRRTHRTPSGNPTKPLKWALLAQFVQSVLFSVHPKGAVANEIHFATAPFYVSSCRFILRYSEAVIPKYRRNIMEKISEEPYPTDSAISAMGISVRVSKCAA